MPDRKPGAKYATDLHRQTLAAVLHLCGVVLLINAWLVSQQIIHF